MNALNTKLTLAALAIAMLATPALAQRPQRQHTQQQVQDQAVPTNQTITYPNPVSRSGSEESLQSGAEFNTDNTGE